MTVEHFESALRQLLQREPFEPFVVELTDGRLIAVEHPNVAFAGGAASFFTPSYDLVEFTCEESLSIRPAVGGAAP